MLSMGVAADIESKSSLVALLVLPVLEALAVLMVLVAPVVSSTRCTSIVSNTRNASDASNASDSSNASIARNTSTWREQRNEVGVNCAQLWRSRLQNEVWVGRLVWRMAGPFGLVEWKLVV